MQSQQQKTYVAALHSRPLCGYLSAYVRFQAPEGASRECLINAALDQAREKGCRNVQDLDVRNIREVEVL